MRVSDEEESKWVLVGSHGTSGMKISAGNCNGQVKNGQRNKMNERTAIGGSGREETKIVWSELLDDDSDDEEECNITMGDDNKDAGREDNEIKQNIYEGDS